MTTPNQPLHRSDNLPLAVTSILAAVFALSIGDALVKLTSERFGIWQVFVIRSAIAVPILCLALRFAASEELSWPKTLSWTALRSLLLVFIWVFYYAALPHMPLSAAAAAYYTSPIFITLLSAVLTGDRVRLSGWIAVILGFAGVLLVLRPGSGAFSAYALLPLLSALLYASAMLLTRTRCRDEHPLVLVLALNVAFIGVGMLATGIGAVAPNAVRPDAAFVPWASMDARGWVAMGILAAAIVIGAVGAALAYQSGPPPVIGTFDFAYIGFAVIWVAVFFAETPDALSIAGMALVGGAGFLSLKAAHGQSGAIQSQREISGRK